MLNLIDYYYKLKGYKYRILKNGRIKALRSFADVKKGDIGGYVENYHNLGHEGNAWVSDNARVRDNAWIYQNARVFGDAEVFDNAKVFDNVHVFGNARVNDNAMVRHSACIYGNAHVYGNASICGDVEVFDNAKVYGNASINDTVWVYGDAQLYGGPYIDSNAKVYGFAHIRGDAYISGNAQVYGSVRLNTGKFTGDCKEDIIEVIKCSLNMVPINGKYIMYKKVNKIGKGKYVSCYDKKFKYELGKIKRLKKGDYNDDWESSCSEGLHVSTPTYWDEGDTLLAVEFKLADIITCQKGKVRCKALKVLYEV